MSTNGGSGRLDAIINLAYAGTTRGPLDELNAERLLRDLEVSVVGIFAGNPEAYQRSVSTIPLGRYGDVEHDIGPAIAFLVGDDARHVTGQTILLDGGQSHL